MDINNPDGTGKLTISRMTIESDSVSFDFEGKVEGYGSVFCSHVMSAVDGDRTRGVMSGEARTFLEDGTFITSPHMGTFKRNNSKIKVFFTDAVNNGLIGDAIAAAQSTFSADNWSLAETNVGQIAFYLQDEWFVNDKFNLTYGLKMDKPLYFDSDKKAQDVIDGTGDYAPGTPYVNPNTGQVQLLDNTKSLRP